MRIDALLARATARLAGAGSPSARLDAEVLAGHVLGVDRTWLYTWGDREFESWPRARFDALVAARADGRPVAYLTGEREFWGLSLETAPSTLIPRPDTETLVETALARATVGEGALLDLGTGTGAIALAFASERPGWRVEGIDLSEPAIALARRNARRHDLAVRFRVSDWFGALDEDERFDLIVANPPYIDAADPHLAQGDVRFEPLSALVASEAGLGDLRRIAEAALVRLPPGGTLLMEHGMSQGPEVRQILVEAGFRDVETRVDLGGRERVTLGLR